MQVDASNSEVPYAASAGQPVLNDVGQLVPIDEVPYADSAAQPAMNNTGQRVPIYEVAFRNGTWWSIPLLLSQQIYRMSLTHAVVGYTWEWDGTRRGSFSPEGQSTDINRYELDFRTWIQRNMDNDRRRSFRLVWVRPQDVDASHTGES